LFGAGFGLAGGSVWGDHKPFVFDRDSDALAWFKACDFEPSARKLEPGVKRRVISCP
jgi:hypothetical protein